MSALQCRWVDSILGTDTKIRQMVDRDRDTEANVDKSWREKGDKHGKNI